MNERMSFVSGGRRYEWGGGYGAIMYSHESGVSVGDVRMIDHELFFAYMVNRRGWFGRDEVCWTVQHVNNKRVSELRRKFFGCQS